MFHTKHVEAGFTLIELLVVIAILAILFIVVLLVLNPAQLLMQARDSNRIQDLATLSDALGIYSEDAAVNGTPSLGAANTVYPSLGDTSATSTAGDQCQGLSLISLPGTYAYQCASPSNYRSVNGTGWVPVNFGSVSIGSPISQLPVDPTDSSSSRLYYTYATNGSQYELTAAMESAKYQLGGSNDVISNDGATLATVYAKGTKLGLEPLDYGDPTLVGYWTFDEGTNSIAYDYSGGNATGTWSGTATGTSGYYSAGKVGLYAGAFDGLTTKVVATSTAALQISGSITMAAWVYPTISNAFQAIIVKGISGARDYGFYLSSAGTSSIYVTMGGSVFNNNIAVSPGWNVNAWNYVAVTANGASIQVYINGALEGSAVSNVVATVSTNPLYLGEDTNNNRYVPNGLVDDIRLYDRALTATQILALYNGGK